MMRLLFGVAGKRRRIGRESTFLYVDSFVVGTGYRMRDDTMGAR
jgi:hypothetical protein